MLNGFKIPEQKNWNVVHFLAAQGLCQILQKHIDKFEESDLTARGGWPQKTPRYIAKQNGHREIVRIIDKRLKDLRDGGERRRPCYLRIFGGSGRQKID